MLRKIKNLGHLFEAVIANIYYRFPSRSMTIIGVTGTDGKTTTSHMIYHMMKREGMKASLISTLAANINTKILDTGHHVTTPTAFALQKYLKMAKDSGNEYVVLEVTSHAIDQYRIWGVPFAVSVLTNVTHEHLDYHKTYEAYAKAKFRLLEMSKTAVVNMDDKSFSHLSAFRKTVSKTQYLTYGFHENADIRLSEYQFLKKLPGVYNWYNGLAAVGVGKFLGISPHEMEKHMASFELPVGRLETVYNGKFKVIVDFAHTPHSLEAVLKTIKDEKTVGRIIHVFGSAGERDKSKRLLMGRVSAKYADVIILTAEDPRGESVADINAEIKSGVLAEDAKASVVVIESRRDAILNALEMADSNDTILITGKGHEDSMNLGDGEEPWSDREAVLEEIKKIDEK